MHIDIFSLYFSFAYYRISLSKKGIRFIHFIKQGLETCTCVYVSVSSFIPTGGALKRRVDCSFHVLAS